MPDAFSNTLVNQLTLSEYCNVIFIRNRNVIQQTSYKIEKRTFTKRDDSSLGCRLNPAETSEVDLKDLEDFDESKNDWESETGARLKVMVSD
jgi:hypothetical protein